jgi:hypothetical protein
MIIDSPIISGSYAASGSLNQVGNVVITGSLTVTGDITGSATNAVSASFAATAVSASYAANATSASYAAAATSASYAVNATSASFSSTASYLENYIPPFPFTGSAGISGSLTVNGNITAQTLIVQTITSSQDFVTGSTRFGSELINTHQFTGSVTISGSLAVNGSSAVLTNQTGAMSVATASFVANAQTASYVQTAQTASFVQTAQTASYVQNAQTASYVQNAQTASYILNAISASHANNANLLDGNDSSIFATTGSNIFTNTQFINSINSSTVSNSSTPSVGSSFQGGKVAYILQPGDPGYDANFIKGFIASTTDQCCYEFGPYSTVGGTGTAIGTGAANTALIIAAYGTGSNYAARFAASITDGGYSDWFLPSRDELAKLYLNRVEIGGFASSYYWSSSEINNLIAAYGDFINGGGANFFKGDALYVRAIRTFSLNKITYTPNPLSISGSTIISGSLNITQGITGSLLGTATTASYVLNAVSSSYALTASYSANVPETASYATSASNALVATSASYALTASYSANVPVTASYANNAASASYALTSSYSLAGGGFPYSGSAEITGSLLVSNLSGTGVRYIVADATGSISAQTPLTAIKLNQVVTASAGQNTFNIPSGYTTGLIDTFINGTKLTRGVEYTDLSGTQIILTTGSFAGDIVEFVVYQPASGVTNNALRALTTFTASTGQTVFSASYVPGLLDIFYNGSRLSNNEYTANNGTFFTLATGSADGDILDVFVYSYQVGAFSGIGGAGSAAQIAYFNTSNSITGSSNFTISGSTMTVTGSLLVSGSGTFTNIGPAVFSGSITSTAGFTGSFSGTATSASYAVVATSASYAASASNTLAAQTASYVLNAVSSSFATSAITSSYADSLTVAGTLTAQTLVVQTITSSVDFVTGSTRFGSTGSNTHQFTGSVSVNGSLSGTSATFSSSVTADDLILTAGTLFGAGNTGFSNRASDTTLYLQMPATGFNITDNALNTKFILSSSGAATFSNRINGVVGGTAYNTAGLWLQGSNSTDGIAIGGTGGGDKTIDTYGGTLKINGTAGNGLSVTGAATFSSSVTATQGNFSLGTVGGAIGSVKNLTVTNSNGAVGDWAGLNFAYYNNTTNFGYIGTVVTSEATNAKADMVFGVKASTSATAVTEYMRIQSGGNVGIGTTSPNYALEVRKSGGIWSTSDDTFGAVLGVYYNTANIGSTQNRFRLLADQNAVYFDGYDAFPLVFRNNGNTERMRITSGGQINHNTSLADWSHTINNGSTTNPYGLYIYYSGAYPNGTSNNFVYCVDSIGVIRATIRSNGGLANYQANDVNLSDIRTKKDIAPLESYWDKFKAIEIVKFKYKDQTHDDFNIGVIAQQVEEIAPEFVDVDGWGDTQNDKDPLKSIYTSDLHHATIKVLQEAMAKITTLEEKLERNNII